MVTPLKSHPQAVPRNPPEGYWGKRVRSRSWPKKKVKIDHFLIFVPKNLSVFFLELFLDVLTTRGHTLTWQSCCGVGVVSVTICGQYVGWDMSVTAKCVLLPRVCLYCQWKFVKHTCAPAQVTAGQWYKGGGEGCLGWRQPGSGFCEVLVSVFFLRSMMCVTKGISFSIRKRSTCWLCYVWIENSYNTCMKSTPSWVVKISTKH